MIPKLTIDEDFIKSTWKNKEDVDYAINLLCPMSLKGIPVYSCDDNWVNIGVFNEFKSTVRFSEFSKYGYCDTEDALAKYLKSYIDDTENSYFVEIGGMSMDYEKYYKNGSYINKDGIDTEEDYYDYIDEHPEMEVQQDYENKWIQFTIYKLKIK